jgi:hypothetical protein
MRHLLASAALIVSGPVVAQDLSKVEIKTEQVAPGVAVLFGAGGNIGVSYGEDGTILIDDQFAPLTEKMSATLDFDAMIGTAPKFRAALAQAAKAARGHGHVLIEGETGTGKEMLMRAMHGASPRSMHCVRLATAHTSSESITNAANSMLSARACFLRALNTNFENKKGF